jgi:hypothetical protein
MNLFWDFILGPVISLLPMRWRKRLRIASDVQWSRAGILSGIYEMLAAIVSLGYWYMFEMTRRIAQVSEVLTSQPGEGATPEQIRGAALFLFWMSPLTWLLFYFFFEGAARLLGAGFTDHVMGTLPLYLAERISFWIRKPEEARVGETVKEHAKELKEHLKEKVLIAGLQQVPDELEASQKEGEEFLEIRSSRKKEDWIAPQVVRMGDLYYRLEQSWVGQGGRPFRYKLRRLSAGVPGRKVILYHPETQ